MDKLKMESKDRTRENFEKLAALFPNAVTETITGYDKEGKAIVERAIDKDVLQQEISAVVVEGRDERYRFTWPDKKKSIHAANAPIRKTLRPCREESVNFDTTENLYIEGDNLDVLKLLQETYLGKVRMIYIDPPYNTGHDFVYHDDFRADAEEYLGRSGQLDDEGNRLFRNTESNGRFHTDWLNMLYPRLKIARDLLPEDGVIVINIDEHEVSNLRKICQEIFGEVNELGTIIWDKRNPKGDSRGIASQHEYILTFVKNKAMFLERNNVQRLKKNAGEILRKAKSLYAKRSDDYTLEDINRDFSKWLNAASFSGGEKAYNKIDEDGNVYRPVSMAWPNKKQAPAEYFQPLIHPVTQKACAVPSRGWRNPPSRMQQMLREGKILFGKDETTIPNAKYLLEDNMYENIPSLLYYGGSDTELLEKMQIPFDTPKVVDICKEHILSFTGRDDIILDFFSGSATTAHAVMELNAEDGGSRKFIMVQLPEACNEKSEAYRVGYRNICEIGKERIRRAGSRIMEKNLPAAEKPDIGFRVLKLDDTNMKDVYYAPHEVTASLLDQLESNIKEDRTPEDLLFQVMLDLGVLLSSRIGESTVAGRKVFRVADDFLIACFDDDVTEETIAAVAKLQPAYYVMRDSSMKSDAVAADFEQIFERYSPQTVRKVL